jgi:hypothetical protein
VTVTRDYVVFTEVGFQHELTALAGRGRSAIHPPYTDIYIVAKKDLTAENRGRAVPHARARVPYESFHEFADYAQDGEDITLYIAHSNGWDINYAVTEADTVWRSGSVPPTGLHGFLPTTVDASPVGRYVINGRTGEVKDRKLFIDPRPRAREVSVAGLLGLRSGNADHSHRGDVSRSPVPGGAGRRTAAR